MDKLKSYIPTYEFYNGEDCMQVVTDYGTIYRFRYSNILPTNGDNLNRNRDLINAVFIDDEDIAYFGKIVKSQNGEYEEDKCRVYIVE